ncbi:MAG TPA: diguanylate cyclase [Thermomicrobiaceae bacterium]|nr:diguanylate cyclase [Thermomicrobiaceae bacterium]
MTTSVAAVRATWRRSPLWPGAAVAAAIGLGFAGFLLLRPVGPTATVWVSNIVQFAGPLLMVLLLAWQVRQCWPRIDRAALGRMTWAPLIFGLGVLSYCAGQLIWIVNEEILHVSTFPAWSDAGFLGLYPCLFAATFLLPGRRASFLSRLKLVVDGLALTVAATTISWFFLLGPIVHGSDVPRLTTLVSSLYPAGDLLLLVCLVVLWIRTDDPRLRRVEIILTAALITIVVGDSIYQHQQLLGTYHTGTVLDACWVTGYLVVLVAAQVLVREFAQWGTAPAGVVATERNDAPDALRWAAYLPYLALPILAFMVLTQWRTPGDGDDYLEWGVRLGAVVFVGLIVLRQLLAIHENQQLHRTLVAEARELSVANARLEALATTDPLTGLPNHRAVNAALDLELERAHRYGRSFAILFVDLDHFKELNDAYGHAAGDTTLAEFARVVRAELRGVDLLSRWGGEEFLAILPEVDDDGAAECAERLRQTVGKRVFAIGGGTHLTCSIGVAAYPDQARERDPLVQLADRAMYAAKRLGRNQVRRAAEPAVVALLQQDQQVNGRDDAALVGVVQALASLVEARDRYTGQHTAEVGRRVRQLALHLGLSATEAHMLGLAGLLHDIGKIGIPDVVLQKPARPTTGEWTVLRQHPGIGAEVVSHIPALRVLAPVIRGHHERWDGTGYPDGLAGEAIPLGARIVAVVDAYGAMTSDRPYRTARSTGWARDELRRGGGNQFDPRVAAAFLEVLADEDAAAARAAAAGALPLPVVAD